MFSPSNDLAQDRATRDAMIQATIKAFKKTGELRKYLQCIDVRSCNEFQKLAAKVTGLKAYCYRNFDNESDESHEWHQDKYTKVRKHRGMRYRIIKCVVPDCCEICREPSEWEALKKEAMDAEFKDEQHEAYEDAWDEEHQTAYEDEWYEDEWYEEQQTAYEDVWAI